MGKLAKTLCQILEIVRGGNPSAPKRIGCKVLRFSFSKANKIGTKKNRRCFLVPGVHFHLAFLRLISKKDKAQAEERLICLPSGESLIKILGSYCQ